MVEGLHPDIPIQELSTADRLFRAEPVLWQRSFRLIMFNWLRQQNNAAVVTDHVSEHRICSSAAGTITQMEAVFQFE